MLNTFFLLSTRHSLQLVTTKAPYKLTFDSPSDTINNGDSTEMNWFQLIFLLM